MWLAIQNQGRGRGRCNPGTPSQFAFVDPMHIQFTWQDKVGSTETVIYGKFSTDIRFARSVIAIAKSKSEQGSRHTGNSGIGLLSEAVLLFTPKRSRRHSRIKIETLAKAKTQNAPGRAEKGSHGRAGNPMHASNRFAEIDSCTHKSKHAPATKIISRGRAKQPTKILIQWSAGLSNET